MKINIVIICMVLMIVVLGGIIYFMHPSISNLLCFVVDVFCLGLDTGFTVGRWKKYGKKQN